MVSRIEIVLILAILFFASRGVVTEISKSTDSNTTEKKNIELLSATLHEVNRSDLQTVITAKRVISYPARTEFVDFRMQTDELVVSSEKVQEVNRTIIMKQKTEIIKNDDTKYYTSNAIYDRTLRVLEILGSFRIKNRYGDINGSSVKYRLNEGKINTGKISAEYEME